MERRDEKKTSRIAGALSSALNLACILDSPGCLEV